MKPAITIKTMLFAFTILMMMNASAQLTYLGDDVMQKKSDGYLSSKRIHGLAAVADKYFFITPNGNFYETDGTQKNTSIKKQVVPQDIGYLQSTGKYVYFTHGGSADIVKNLVRYNPSSGFSDVKNVSSNNNILQLNQMIVPGQKYSVDEMFTSYDKNDLLIRKFNNDNFYLYIINDFNDNANANLVYTSRLNPTNLTSPIDLNTQIETFNGDVYVYGRQIKKAIFQTTINVIKPISSNPPKYEVKNNYALTENKMFPYKRFLRTDHNLYNLFKWEDSVTKKNYLNLYYFNDKSISSIQNMINYTEIDVESQVMDGEIYVSFTGSLLKYREATKTFTYIIAEKAGAKPWEDIAKNARFLKAGNYYMFRHSGALSVYNTLSQSEKEVGKTILARNYNLNTQHSIYAYAGDNSFYFTQRINDKEVFTRYNPTNETYTAIEFPVFKNQRFEEIKAILQNGNSFIFLTSYRGKKDLPVYKIFMYKEDGASLVTRPTEVLPAVIPPPKPVTKPIDLASYNKQLFTAQLIKILNDQSNQFNNITGAALSSGTAPTYQATVELEGFRAPVIIDYKRDSKIMRYEAKTDPITGKDAGLAFLTLLDTEVQKLVAGQGIQRLIEVDVKTRRQINYINTDGHTLLQLDLYTPTDFTSGPEAVFSLTLRADKKTK